MIESLRVKKTISFDGIQDYYWVAEVREHKPKLLRGIIDNHLHRNKVKE